MCRSIPLGGGNTGLPKLWLEMRPVRAAAAQPQIDAHNMTLTVGVQADTRITAKETKPNCPFPATIELVPPMQNGKLTVGLPIDIPFTMLNALLEAQLKGHHYPEQKDAPVDVTVRGVQVVAAGDRLLITLKVHAVEKKSWFGLGANATINVWGKPVLDTKNQILRFTDIVLAVQIAGRLRPAQRGGARGDALSHQGDRRQRGGRPQAVRRRRAQEDRLDLGRIPQHPAGRAGRRRGQRPAPHRHRLRRQDAARHRRRRRHGEGGGQQAAEALKNYKIYCRPDGRCPVRGAPAASECFVVKQPP